MDRSELLVKYGFINDRARGNYEQNKKTKEFKRIDGKKISGKDADQEVVETLSGPFGAVSGTGFPKPSKTYRLGLERYDLSLEESYFWVLDNLKLSFPHIDKIEDTFAAAENSAFFGMTQQRLGVQQDRVSSFMANVGRMIKELFQMVRELRVIDERLNHYNAAFSQLKKPMPQRERRSEITLKGMFVDLVQGGGKSPASVYGMAQQLEFITLPDLFFDAPPFKNGEELETFVNSLEKDFNRQVTRVLKRHLNQFFEWKRSTQKEHENRRRFMLQYLLQHYQIIQMYVAWIKPYLRNTEKLHLKAKNMASADIIASFEGSMLDIEILAHKPMGEKFSKKFGTSVSQCILVTFNYRTRAELKVQQEGYNRGPVHIGKMEMNIRAYNWTDEDIANYKLLKEEEIFYLMGDISKTVQGAMDSLGEELKIYIEEAKQRAGVAYDKELLAQSGESSGDDDKKSSGSKSSGGFLGTFFNFKPSPKKSLGKSTIDYKALNKWKNGKPVAGMAAWLTYNNFKKSHRMIAW